METTVKFTDKDVDGCGTDISTLAKVRGQKLDKETINRVRDAIFRYKEENEMEWDTDGCLDAAKEQLNADGYDVEFMNNDVDFEIDF